MKKVKLVLIGSFVFLLASVLLADNGYKWKFQKVIEVNGSYKVQLCGYFGNNPDKPVIMYLDGSKNKRSLYCIYSQDGNWKNNKIITVWKAGKGQDCIDFSCAVNQQGEPCVAYLIKKDNGFLTPDKYEIFYRTMNLNNKLSEPAKLASYEVLSKYVKCLSFAFNKSEANNWCPCVIYSINRKRGTALSKGNVKFIERNPRTGKWLKYTIDNQGGTGFSLKYNSRLETMVASYARFTENGGMSNCTYIVYAEEESHPAYWNITCVSDGNKNYYNDDEITALNNGCTTQIAYNRPSMKDFSCAWLTKKGWRLLQVDTQRFGNNNSFYSLQDPRFNPNPILYIGMSVGKNIDKWDVGAYVYTDKDIGKNYLYYGIKSNRDYL